MFRMGEGALLVRCGGTEKVHALVDKVASHRIPVVLDLHPAYESVLVEFNPLATGHAELETLLASLSAEKPPAHAMRTIEIPVAYGGEHGPDLEELAKSHGMSPEEVVRLHSGACYSVAFLGFQPGFGYLSGLPASLATPRLAAPRVKVPAGSVGIAGGQTGVYSFASPGGWRIIGRTSLELFSPRRDPPSLLGMGDTVRFRPVGRLS
jgi:inhibitor of KinA